MSNGLLRAAAVCVFVGTIVVPVASFANQSCESLSSMKLSDTLSITATSVPAGPFSPNGGGGARATAPAAAPADGQAPAARGNRGGNRGGGGGDAQGAPTVDGFTPLGGAPAARGGGGGRGPAPVELPAFCRVQLTVDPTLMIEVWLPASGWNGNFEGVGNGGLAGTISFPAMEDALKKGYATASTDTGHQGGSAAFALGDPTKDPVVKKKIEDFGYLGIHEMTVKGKQLAEAFYGMGPRESFFSGCSQGGRQALTEAQRYPDDYTGILAGAPAVNNAALYVAHEKVALATFKDEESYIPPAKLDAIQSAALAACDELDGLKDNLLTDPRSCHFDPSVLLCKGEDSNSCLTAKQVQTIKNLYNPVLDLKGKVLYPGHFPGAEKGWAQFTTGTALGRSAQLQFGSEYMKYFIFKDANWDYKTWNEQTDLPKVMSDEWLRDVMDSWNANLKPYRDKGGKLIVYQGWGDDDVSPINTINYYKMVVTAITGYGKGDDAYSPEPAAFLKASQQTGDFMRLFMIPGMNHCGGGLGPNTFDGVSALDTWRTKKQAPDSILATHLTAGTVDGSRPLCPYPQTAQYSGSGSITDAANFSCKMPKAK